MADGKDVGACSAEAESASVERTILFLHDELDRLDPDAPAAELYEAFIRALHRVYPR